MSIVRKAFLAMSVWMFFAAHFLQGAERKCSIRFIVLDLDGKPVPYQVRTFLSEGNELKAEFRRQEAVVPCATYQYELERSDVNSKFGRLLGKVSLDLPGSVVMLTPDPTLEITQDGVFALDRFGLALIGHVELDKETKPTELMRISFIQLATDKRVDAIVTRDGTFRLASAPRGLNSVYVYKPDGTIYHRIYQFGGGVGPDFTLRFTERVKPASLEEPAR